MSDALPHKPACYVYTETEDWDVSVTKLAYGLSSFILRNFYQWRTCKNVQLVRHSSRQVSGRHGDAYDHRRKFPVATSPELSTCDYVALAQGPHNLWQKLRVSALCWISVFFIFECCILLRLSLLTKTKKKLNSMVWVRERTISTERPPFLGEVSANFCG
jgi:hypothetical protein